jgi:predicted nucleotidyltransferase
VLARHPEIIAAVLFGSRAKMSHQPESDIDLALHGNLDSLRAESIAAELDELPLPYRFDVKAYSGIRSAQLRDHIQRVGVVIFKNDASC